MELNVFRNMFFCLNIGLYVLKKKYKKKCNNKKNKFKFLVDVLISILSFITYYNVFIRMILKDYDYPNFYFWKLIDDFWQVWSKNDSKVKMFEWEWFKNVYCLHLKFKTYIFKNSEIL